MSTGVVAALSVEARLLGPTRRRERGFPALADGTLVAVSGIGAAAAGTSARLLAEAGVSGLVSWGLAGGLDPALTAGTLCVPALVMTRLGVRLDTDARWRERVAAALPAAPPPNAGILLTEPQAIDDLAGKAAAFRATGAVAVDMESVAIGAVAAAHGLPFIALRVIVDTAFDVLPRAVLAASIAGQVRPLSLLANLLRAPGDLLPLWRLAIRYRHATQALLRIGRSGVLAPQPSAPSGGR